MKSEQTNEQSNNSVIYKLGLINKDYRIKEDETETKVVEQKLNSEEHIWYRKFSQTLTSADHEKNVLPKNVKRRKDLLKPPYFWNTYCFG